MQSLCDEQDHAYGSQASILASALKGVVPLGTTTRTPITSSISLSSSSSSTSTGVASRTGESSSESTSPEGLFYTSRRSLLQALQLSQVLLSTLDKTSALGEPELAQNPAVALEAIRTRLQAFKELALKNNALEKAALEALDGMGAPVLHEAVGAGTLSSHKEHGGAWMSMAEVAKLLRGPVTPQQEDVQRTLQLENTKLCIKVDGLQRQVQLLSSSLAAATTSKALSASSSPAGAAVRPPSSSPPRGSSHPHDDDAMGRRHADAESAKTLSNLRRALEEKEELVSGLRKRLFEVCSGKTPLVEERNELQQKLATLLQSQAHLLEERESLEAHCTRIEGQLRRTADRCAELEASLVAAQAHAHGPAAPPANDAERTAADTIEGPTTTRAAMLPQVATTTPVVVRPDAAAAAAAAAGTRDRERRQPPPSFLQWLLSFFLEPDDDEDDTDEAATTPIIV